VGDLEKRVAEVEKMSSFRFELLEKTSKTGFLAGLLAGAESLSGL